MLGRIDRWLAREFASHRLSDDLHALAEVQADLAPAKLGLSSRSQLDRVLPVGPDTAGPR